MYPTLKIALRDSETATRPYVLVNPLLAKHVPAEPTKVFEYFALLGDKVAEVSSGERVLVIGFAETATAVGAAVAAAIKNSIYVHTTRERMPEDKLVTRFTEDHSHAKNQALYLNDEIRDLDGYDRIVFVEDEITTGKTILNFLKSVNWRGKITVSALVFNGFDVSAFSEYDAAFVCLQKTVVHPLVFGGLPNARLGADGSRYRKRCLDLAVEIRCALDNVDVDGRNVLVVGTEEFMYPALCLGCELERTAKSVKCHSTTRSPLLPRTGGDYPIKTRNSFASVYDDARTTYLYNLDKYDTVIVVTDSDVTDPELLRVIQGYGNQNIYLVRIRNDE